MILLTYSAISLYFICFSDGSKMKLIPSDTMTIHRNGATHEITKYIMMPLNDNTNENKLDIATEDNNITNHQDFDNLYKHQYVSSTRNGNNYYYRMYPGAVYYKKARYGNYDGEINKVTSYNNHNVKNINDKHGNLNSKITLTRHHLANKTNPELIGVFNGNDNIIGNNYGETSIVDQEDLNSDSFVKSVPLPSKFLSTYNTIQQQYKSRPAEYNNDSFDISNNNSIKGTDSKTSNDDEMNSHIDLPVNDSDMAVHLSQNKNNGQLSNMNYIYVPTNKDLENYSEIDMQKPNIPTRTVNKYHWSFKTRPNGQFANKHNIDLSVNDVVPENYGNMLLPKKTISTHHWSYNKQPENVISNKHNVDVPANSVSFENDGQIDMQKMVPDKTVKNFHWSFENQPNDYIINGNNIDMPVNDLLRENDDEMNMQKMILPERGEGTDQWTFDKSINVEVANHNDITGLVNGDLSENADENNDDIGNDALSENDGSMKIQPVTIKYISTNTVPNIGDSRNENEDISIDQATNNIVLISDGDQEVPENVPSVLATDTEETSRKDDNNKQNIASKDVVDPELLTNLYSNTNRLLSTPESVTVITSFEEEQYPETNKIEITMPAPKAEMLLSAERNVDSSEPSQTESANAETNSLKTISNSSDRLLGKSNENPVINNPLDNTTESMDISEFGIETKSLVDPEYTKFNGDHQLDIQETLPERIEEPKDASKSKYSATVQPKWNQNVVIDSSANHIHDDVQDTNNSSENLNLLAGNVTVHPEELNIGNSTNSVVKSTVIDKLRTGDGITQSRWLIIMPKLNYMKPQIPSNLKEIPVPTKKQINYLDTENKGFHMIPKISYAENRTPDIGRIGDYYADLQDDEFSDVKHLNIDEYEIPYATLKESAAAGLELHRNTPNYDSFSNSMEDYKLTKGHMLDQPQTQNIVHNNYFQRKLNPNFPHPVKVSSKGHNSDLYFKKPQHVLHGTYTVPASSPYYSLFKLYPLLAHASPEYNDDIYDVDLSKLKKRLQRFRNVENYEIPENQIKNILKHVTHESAIHNYGKSDVDDFSKNVLNHITNDKYNDASINDVGMMSNNEIYFKVDWVKKAAIESKYNLNNLKWLLLSILLRTRDYDTSDVKALYNYVLNYIAYLDDTGVNKSAIRKEIHKIERQVSTIVPKLGSKLKLKNLSPYHYFPYSNYCWHCNN